ncbi:PREDICTED: cucumber peeling [Prunus dulcis]|uniref:PREDICTED: cucumber peeling n=1 Tax=Prunus dulcis TaxID=3755 RepID=A0A5E4E4Q8_PRUDU|nr:cucumber peeling cupredoxin-like [Prunus dulcis]VVA10773.1 PREDICTED: cucumber peeling [Prunus dulcis]
MASKLVSHNVRAAVFVIVIAAAAALIIERAEAETHTVGGASGWTNTLAPEFYTSWAANHTFKVGDILVFEFTTGGHDVARLGKEAFDACNNTDLLSPPENQGPAKYSLNQTGDYYFICAFPAHCSQGQKLSIKVIATGPSAPAPAPHSEAPTTPTAPAPNSEPPKTPSPSPSASPSSQAETPPSEATTPSSSPPTRAATTAPPPSSASSLASAISTFMSIAIALFYLF